MSKLTVNITDLETAAARCAEIGFPIDALVATVDVWIAGKNAGTDLHAASFGGTIGWHEAVRTIREEGIPHGLDPLSRRGVELCVNYEKRTAVVIAQGDARTGDIEHLQIKPSTKYPRGPVSRAVLKAQMPLFSDEEQGPNIDSFDVWLLMMYMTPNGDTRAELSLPSLISDAGEILDWHERIFLGTFSGNTIPRSEGVPTDLSPTEDIAITVKKRG